ncbi:serine protease [Pedobacter sp. GR22-6]|uniref:serine protease n=1 Tax=Pedobacter sp. GR22-6 TaxID=3127957 RepID=UPI00307E0B47
MSRNLLLILIAIAPAMVFGQQAEEWISKPKSQWPKIALINQVSFKNGDRYIDPSFKYAATGFLIDNGTDTLAATAKHMLWIARNKKSNAVAINDDLNSWTMTPKGSDRDTVVIEKLLNEDPEEILEGPNSSILERDWLIFSVQKVTGKLFPLKPRYTSLKHGEKVYILSCAYEDSLCTVHEGKVYKKLGMDILIRRDMKTHKGGCSGSPVIDAAGHLIGIISSSTGTLKGDMSVAVSTEYLKAVLDNKPGINEAKKDYGRLVYNEAIQYGAKAAIRKFRQLSTESQAYYHYNLRSSNRNGLRECGEKLLQLKRHSDAVSLLNFNLKINGKYYINYNILGNALIAAGKKNAAIKAFKRSIKSYNGSDNEAYAALSNPGK